MVNLSWYLMWTLAEDLLRLGRGRATGPEAFRRLDEARRLNAEVGYRANAAYGLHAPGPGWSGPGTLWGGRVPRPGRRRRRPTKGATPSGRPGPEVNLGAILAELGALDEAVERLEEGRSAAERGEPPHPAPQGPRPSCFRPDRGVSVTSAAEPRDLARRRGAPGPGPDPTGTSFLYGLDAYLAVAGVRLAGGRTAEAADLVAPLFTAAEDAAWAEGTARAALFLGECSRRCGDPDAAEAFLGRALDDATNAGLAVEWEAHAALARLPRDHADTAAADEHQRRARTVVDTLAAAITDAGLRRCFLSRVEALLDQPPVR